MQLTLEAAGSGMVLGCLSLPPSLLNASTSCFMDLQTLVFDLLSKSSDTSQAAQLTFQMPCQVRVFDGHCGPELTCVASFDLAVTTWTNWLTKVRRSIAQTATATAITATTATTTTAATTTTTTAATTVISVSSYSLAGCLSFSLANNWVVLRDVPAVNDDEACVLAAVQKDGLQLEFASARLRNCVLIAHAAVKQNKRAVVYVSKRLQLYPDFALACLETRGFCPSQLECCREFVLRAAHTPHMCLRDFPMFADDKEVVVAALQSNALNALHVSPRMAAEPEVAEIMNQQGMTLLVPGFIQKNYQELVMDQVAKTPCMLERVDQTLACYKQIVLRAVASDGYTLQYASESMKADRDVVLQAVKQEGRALQHAQKLLQADKELVQLAVQQNGVALMYAHESLQHDRQLVLQAVASKGLALASAAPTLQADKQVVMTAVGQDGSALMFASSKLQADKDVVMQAVKQDTWAFGLADNLLQRDVDIIKETIKTSLDAFMQFDRRVDLQSRVFTDDIAFHVAHWHAASALSQPFKFLHSRQVMFACVEKSPQALRTINKKCVLTPKLQNDVARHFVACWPRDVVSVEAKLCCSQQLCMRILYHLQLAAQVSEPGA